MAKPGPRPRPTHLKVLAGDKPSRINGYEPMPSEVPIEPPYELDDDVQDVWDRHAPDRISKGVLTHWDVDAFAFWCEAVVLARRKLEAAGKPAEPGAASPMSDFKTAMSILDDLGAAFGWTPSDRSRLVIREVGTQPAERLLSGDDGYDDPRDYLREQ